MGNIVCVQLPQEQYNGKNGYVTLNADWHQKRSSNELRSAADKGTV
jgi:hypothetical protein